MKKLILVITFLLFTSTAWAYPVNWNLIDDDFNDLSLWNDVSIGSGGYSEINPAGQLHLDSTVVADANAGAVDHWVIGGIPDNFVIEVRTFLNTIGTGTGNSYTIQVGNGIITLWIQLRSNGLFTTNKNDIYNEVGTDIVQVGQWQEWKFVVRAADNNVSNCDVYLNGSLIQSNIPCGSPGNPITDGFIWLGQPSYNIHTESHTDYFRMGTLVFPVSATINLKEVKIKFKDKPNDDKFTIKGEFVLGDGSNGIDPIIEDVTVNVGTSSIIIPAPYSFVEEKAGVFKYKGIINSTDVEMEIKTKDYVTYNFKVKVKGTDLTDTSNPVDVGLTIGDDTGTANVRLKGELMFGKKH